VTFVREDPRDATDLEHLRTALAHKYVVEKEIGRGGAAVVYLGTDLKHRRKVAIKALRPELSSTIGAERFLREIEIAAGLNHPHILSVHDSGDANGILYFVMPFIEGESLRRRLARDRRVSVNESLKIAGQVADALDFAHRNNIVHRDIKPENILLSDGHAIVADFGIARAISLAGQNLLTEPDMVVGTPGYMSPEQVMASQPLDGRSDIYSLGCVLHEMLVGKAPKGNAASNSTTAESILCALNEQTESDQLTPTLKATVSKALARAPEQRFDTAAQFRTALLPGNGGEDLETGRHPARPTWQRGGLMLVAVFLLLAATMLTWNLAHSHMAAQNRIDSIAVLPFRNLTNDSTLDYFVDGMHETLISELANISSVTVISRTSVTRYRNSDKSLSEIASELNVDALVEGAVLGLGDSVRITVRLVDAETEERLVTHTHEGSLANVLALQAEAAAHIVRDVRASRNGNDETESRR
jgi:eukaryotic-like serine/threonine-protein kinase